MERRWLSLGGTVAGVQQRSPVGVVEWLTVLGDVRGSVAVTVPRGSSVVTSNWWGPYGARRGSRVDTVGTRGYLGQAEDVGSGLTYLNNRYYDPSIGEFISVDPLVSKTGDPYLYANGNPTTLSDPNGLDPKWAYDNDRCNDDGYYECVTARGGSSAGQQVVAGPGRRQCAEGRFIRGCGSVVRAGEPCNLVGNCGDVNAITRDPCSLVSWRAAQSGGSPDCAGSAYDAFVNALGSWKNAGRVPVAPWMPPITDAERLWADILSGWNLGADGGGVMLCGSIEGSSGPGSAGASECAMADTDGLAGLTTVGAGSSIGSPALSGSLGLAVSNSDAEALAGWGMCGNVSGGNLLGGAGALCGSISYQNGEWVYLGAWSLTAGVSVTTPEASVGYSYTYTWVGWRWEW